MKRILPFILAIIMVFSVALAESNLSDMSYSELIALQKEVVKEIMSRPEWKEVVVPAGTWIVGEDIPVGKYSFRIYQNQSVVIHLWGAAVDDYDRNGGLIISDYRDQDIGKVELKDGNVLVISKPMIIAPPMTLGF